MGLDQLLANGWTITRAVKSTCWPGKASLEVAKLWLQQRSWRGSVLAEGEPVARITSLLEPGSRVDGAPYRLMATGKRSFIGSFVNGIGFVLKPEAAETLARADPRNGDVLFRYLTGDDLNSHPEQRPGRWIINFFDWSLEQAEECPDCLEVVRQRVKPERDKVNRKAHRERWWIYGDRRPLLYAAIKDMKRVPAIAATSKLVQPSFVPVGQVFSHALAVFAHDDDAHFGLLSSAFHWWWAVSRASTMRTDVRYTPRRTASRRFPSPTSLTR